MATTGLYRGPNYRRIAAVGGAWTTVAIGILLLLPATSAAAPLVVEKAPYSGAHPFYAHSFSRSLCGTAHFVVAQHFNVSSGAAVVAIHAGGKNCVGRDSASASEGLMGPGFNASSSGTFNVTFKWRVSWTANATAFGAVGKAAQRGAITLLGNLFDATARSWVLGGTAPTPASRLLFVPPIYGSWHSSGVNKNFTVTFSANLTSGDHYMFYAELQTNVLASMGTCFFGCTPGTSLVNVNVGSGGNGAWLLSMKVT